MSIYPQPIRIEIKIRGNHGETTIVATQLTNSIGKIRETKSDLLRRVVADARSWLNRNELDSSPY